MNLFRSEEHAKAWPHYDPASEEGILPVADWAEIFAGPLFRNRREPEYLANQGKYYGAIFSTLTAMGKTGPFWEPPPR
jgi:hypothetical protein